MIKRNRGLSTVFMVLLIITAVGIVYHWVSGYDYPATPAMTYEVNVLGDPYELFFVVPLGLVGLWALRKGGSLGPVLIAGVAAHFVYNYAMFVTGAQNPWIFVWVLKLALSGAAVCLVWRLLPEGPGHRTKSGLAIAAYLTVVLLVFSKMMGQRLLASAMGRTLDMTMQAAGALDWGEPFLRDPIIFFSMACPIVITAILGLSKGTDWGGRAASLATSFVVSIVAVVLFTGPLKEFLQKGAVSPGMWAMSAVMVLAAAPAVWSLIWLCKNGHPSTKSARSKS